MKATTIIAALLIGTVTAAPGAISLKRSFIEVGNSIDNRDALTPCVECPCNGFFGSCICVKNGCCRRDCKWPRA